MLGIHVPCLNEKVTDFECNPVTKGNSAQYPLSRGFVDITVFGDVTVQLTLGDRSSEELLFLGWLLLLYLSFGCWPHDFLWIY